MTGITVGIRPFPHNTLNLKRRPRVEGALACLTGKCVTSCPYPSTTPEYLQWITGWVYQSAELEDGHARRRTH